MARGIFILGNGFDLDLGLATSYSLFALSEQWDELMDRSYHSSDEGRLLGFLKSKYQIELWIDIEAALLEFALKKTMSHNVGQALEDRTDFEALCQSLKSYLLQQQKSFSTTKNSVASLLLKKFGSLRPESMIYTFNYTEPKVLAGALGRDMTHNVAHIHGSLSDGDNIILGIETREVIDDQYAFLFKTQNRYYRHTNIMGDLRDKDEYVFFGHALNGMDYAYFRNTFVSLYTSISKTPRLTIITKDARAEESFKVFLRKERIPLQDLYSNSIPTFILTDEVYRGNEEEKMKVRELMERMSGM